MSIISTHATIIGAAPAIVAHTAAAPAYRFFRVAKIGAGAWYTLHLLAAHGEREALEAVLLRFSKSFTCVKCRVHVRKFLARNAVPVDRAALFAWTVEFHNSVSARIYEERGEARPIISEIGAAALLRELVELAESDERAGGESCGGCEDTPAPAPSRAAVKFVSQ